MRFIPSLLAATSLSTVIGAASAACRNGRASPPEVCLSTFVWCDTSQHCEFPNNVWPITTDWRGHGMLADNETYTVAWDGTLRDDSVELQVAFRSTLQSKIRKYTDFSYLIPLAASSGYTFEPYQLLVDIADSAQFNGTLSELQGMAATMKLQIRMFVTRNGVIIPVDGNLESDYFSIMSWPAPAAADWQKDHAFDRERRRWQIGVGIGVGLGLPIVISVTAFLTKRMVRRPQGKSRRPRMRI